MFGKEKKPRKPKSKTRKIIDWVVTGVFAALLVGLGVIQIVNRTSKNQNVFGPQYQKVITDSMVPTYKVNDVIVIKQTTPEELYHRVTELHEEDVDVSFYWNVNGQRRSMTHRLQSVTYYEEPQYNMATQEYFHFKFVAHGINKQSNFCRIGDQYGDCTTQTQTFNEYSLIGRVVRKSPIMTFVTSIWGLLVLLLIPCLYLIIASVFDIVKAVDDKEPATANGEVVGEASDKPKDPLEGLSEKEKEKLKKQMLDEMLGKKK